MTASESTSPNYGDHESPWEDIGYDHPFQPEAATASPEEGAGSEERKAKEAARLALQSMGQAIPDHDTGDQAAVTYIKLTSAQLLRNRQRRLEHIASNIAALEGKMAKVREETTWNDADEIAKKWRIGQLNSRVLAEKAKYESVGESIKVLLPPESSQETLF